MYQMPQITFTGPDDNTDIQRLLTLEVGYRHLEYGILFSESRRGTPRYPTDAWIERLVEASGSYLNLSAHFCGKIARDTLAGDDKWVKALPMRSVQMKSPAFRRIQLNGYDPTNPIHVGSVVSLAMTTPYTYILQARSMSDYLLAGDTAATFTKTNPIGHGHGKLAVLYDPSGGKGLTAKVWPEATPIAPVGFAGGINPDNVREVLTAIGYRQPTVPGHPAYWIDMESGVRTDEKFDLAKCQRVLDVQQEVWYQWQSLRT